jgi:hypothetical protein
MAEDRWRGSLSLAGRNLCRRPEAGQASVEAVAAIPALLLAGLICAQLLAAGWALTLADGAAEAGAMAVAAGLPAKPAALDALPGWARGRARVAVGGGRVTVRVRPPSPAAGLARGLEMDSSAWVRPPGGG